MARKDDKFSNLSKELDEEFDYEREIEEIERQERELEAYRKQKEEEQKRKQEQQAENQKTEKEQPKRRPTREQRKEAEFLGERFDPDTGRTQPKKKGKKGIIFLIILLLALIAGGGTYFYKMKMDERTVADFEAKVASFQTEKLEDVQLGDKQGYFDDFIQRCQDAIDAKDLTAISKLNSEWSDMEKELTDATNGKMAIDSFVYSAQETLASYYITDNYKETYDTLIKDMNAAKESNQFEKISSLQKNLDSLTTSLKAEDLKVVQNVKNQISEMDLDQNYLSDSQKTELKKYADTVAKNLDDGNYAEAIANLNKWKASAAAVSEAVTSKKAEEIARAESEAEELRRQREAEQAAAQAARESELREQLARQEAEESSSSSGSGGDGSYIFPDSSSRYLSESELSGLSESQLMYARNEIYARHGYIFQDAGLRQYFEGKSWYHGTVSASDFTSSMLSAVEQANIKLIQKFE